MAIYLFIYFKIPQVIGDLSGRTAKKKIAQIRDYSQNSGGNSAYKANPVPVRQTPAKAAYGGAKNDRAETDLLDESHGGYAGRAEETMPLSEETMPLAEETMPLSEETMILTDETMMLSDETALLDEAADRGGVKLTMIESVMLIHTNEAIV